MQKSEFWRDLWQCERNDVDSAVRIIQRAVRERAEDLPDLVQAAIMLQDSPDEIQRRLQRVLKRVS